MIIDPARRSSTRPTWPASTSTWSSRRPPEGDDLSQLTESRARRPWPTCDRYLEDGRLHADPGHQARRRSATRSRTRRPGSRAWIVEKFRAWSDCGGDVERSFTKDQLLTNVMLYWVTATAHSSARLYYEAMQAGRFGVGAATASRSRPAAAIFPREIARPPAQLGREPATTHPLDRDAARRPLRGDGAARAVRRRRARLLPLVAMTDARRRATRSRELVLPLRGAGRRRARSRQSGKLFKHATFRAVVGTDVYTRTGADEVREQFERMVHHLRRRSVHQARHDQCGGRGRRRREARPWRVRTTSCCKPAPIYRCR